VATIAQLLGMVIDTQSVVTGLMQDFRNAPDDLQRCNTKVSSMNIILDELEKLLRNQGDELALPPDLRQNFSDCLTQVQRDLSLATKYLQSIKGPSSSLQLRERATYALMRGRRVGEIMHHLKDSEDNLQTLINLLNLLVLKLLLYSCQLAKLLSSRSITTLLVNTKPQTLDLQTDTKVISPNDRLLGASSHKTTLFSVDSVLRNMEFYGYCSFETSLSGTRRVMCIGSKGNL
jgi:hypothetical protein